MNPTDAAEPFPGCAVRAVGFDFAQKHQASLRVADLPTAFERGWFVWIDIALSDTAQSRALIESLHLVTDDVIEMALTREAATQVARYPDYVHFVVSDGRLAGATLELTRIDCVMSARFLLTIHREDAACLQAVRRNYPEDFQRFAQTPSFLVYELWDQLIETYLTIHGDLEERVASLRNQLVREADDRAFERVAELSSDLLHFRKVLLPARTVLHDLGTRRTLFLSEMTQQFLLNLVGTVEHVLQELLVDREILSEALDLHMSLVAHRTNKVMNRLTVVSVIFLPLTFLCGVYGMNFQHLPELEWRYGYALFWLLAVLIAGLVAWFCRRIKLW
jgi:magnesium transporter